jgi:GNAT superfamily N-acetyltransferase
MPDRPYRIIPYRRELRHGVADLLRPLLGDDLPDNEAYLAWKYEANPFSNDPLGVVALHRDKPVGFRGYFATRWTTGPGAERLRVLAPGDTCVHPDYRRRGLSVELARRAGEFFADRAPVQLNLTCGRSSFPGYRRAGFAPLAPKGCWNRYRLAGLLRGWWSARRAAAPPAPAVECGRFGDVAVDQTPRPADMASAAASVPAHDRTFTLCRDVTFFRWRFANPRRRYLFYYRLQDGAVAGYLVMGLAGGGVRGYLLDGADTDGAALLRYVVQGRRLPVLSVQHAFAVNASLASTLRRLGFRETGLLRRIERRRHGEFPVMVRPLRAEPTEDDWHVDGLDVRDIGNWTLHGICSDAW